MKIYYYIVLIFFCCFLTACAGPLKLYSGPPLPKKEVSRIYLASNPSITSGLNIRITQLDERDFVQYPPSYFQAYVTPGPHKIRASFMDSKLSGAIVVGIVDVKESHFQGYYDFNFISQANKSYIAMFDLDMDKKNWLKKMCIYERDFNVSNTGNGGKIITCSEPSIPINEESIKLCKTYRNLPEYLNRFEKIPENCTLTK